MAVLDSLQLNAVLGSIFKNWNSVFYFSLLNIEAEPAKQKVRDLSILDQIYLRQSGSYEMKLSLRLTWTFDDKSVKHKI